MKQGFKSHHWADSAARPAGGVSSTEGAAISWQNGPLGNAENRQAANGAFVEDIIDIVIDRIQWYQTVNGGQFACDENSRAIEALQAANDHLDRRTARRQAAGTERTYEGN